MNQRKLRKYLQLGKGWLKGWVRLWEAEAVDHLKSGVLDQPGQHGETLSLLYTKISQAWWQALAIPANQEAESGESLETGRERLQ